MATGTIKVITSAAFDALPVPDAEVLIFSDLGELLYRTTTDSSGTTDELKLDAPDALHTLSPTDPGPYYTPYTVEVRAAGYEAVRVEGVQIFDGQLALLPVEMHPQARSGAGHVITIPENALSHNAFIEQPTPFTELPPSRMPRFAGNVIIPETITVHLGTPASNARNVRVSFADYIKNVASSEIYPTWPAAALEANIYCQISYALNRVYTEWYPSRGYAFHITNSTAYDQYFVDGRNIYANISQIVDRIFNVFIRRMGHAEPFFAQYCNGTTVTCSGLSQWGTVPLAQQGLDAHQILRRYYPADIALVASNEIAGISESYPGTLLRQGSQGSDVQRMQLYLNRIRVNYPSIPQISSPNGNFAADTTAAVRTFQGIFSLTADGIIGKSTWYKIIQIYTGIKKLADMESEGERIGIGTTPPSSILRQGSKGRDVLQLQFLLNFIAEFYNDIPLVLENSSFDVLTQQSVLSFQRRFQLSADGIVGPATWNKLYEIYNGIENITTPPPIITSPEYPGVLLRSGSRGDSVRVVQQYLNEIYKRCPGYSALLEDGIFGNATEVVVRSFQGAYQLAVDGIIGPATWDAIVKIYSQLSL